MQIIKKSYEEKEPDILGQIKTHYLPYWPIFLVLIAIFMVGAWTYVHFSTPIYEVTAKILIKDEKKGTEDAKAVEDINIIAPKKIIENEMEVIQSKSIVGEVAKDLCLYAPISEKTRFGLKSAFSTSPVNIQMQNPDTIVSQKQVFFQYNYSTAAVTLDGKSYGMNSWYNTPYGVLRFIKNTSYDGQEKPESFSFSLTSLKNATNSISSRLKITAPNKQSTIVVLSLTDEIPQRGEKILNSIIEAYSNALVAEKNDLAVYTLSFIDERLKTIKYELDSVESKLQSYRSSRGAVDLSAQSQMYLQGVGQNDQKLGEINMQLSVLDQVNRYVQSKDVTGRIVPSTMGVNDPLLSGLVTNLYDAEMKYENLKTTAGDSNSMTLAVKSQIDQMRPSIAENIENHRRELQASRSSMAGANSSYSALLSNIPTTERNIVGITREQALKSSIYNFLQNKREETALSQISNQADSRIVDRAESSDGPVSPKKKLIYFSSMLLALFSGIGVVFVKEKASNRVMFRRDIESLTELPIIGEISAESSKNPIVIDDRRKTLIAEQFRKLRVSLNYIGVNTNHKRILVTSSISGEGKSFIATNLAISLAITGKKVVLLDFDLNNPSLNNKLNIKNQKGITEYLLNEIEAEEIIHKTDLHENLSLISTGKLPFNPSELVMSENVEKLLDYLNEKYDYIVIDTAPVAPVTDAYILSKYCDATLFIVRHNYSPRVLVELIDSNNKMNNLKNSAIVFNGVKARGFGKQGYGYGYSYGTTYPGTYGQKQLN